jgi:hypothetical protein
MAYSVVEPRYCRAKVGIADPGRGDLTDEGQFGEKDVFLRVGNIS